VIHRGVEGVFGGDLRDVPRWHVGADAKLFFGSDLVVASEELTNSSFMGISRAFACVGSGAKHTIYSPSI